MKLHNSWKNNESEKDTDFSSNEDLMLETSKALVWLPKTRSFNFIQPLDVSMNCNFLNYDSLVACNLVKKTKTKTNRFEDV